MATFVGPCPTPRDHGGAKLRCRSRRCPSCGQLWAGDTRTRVLANVEAYDGDVVLGTITAPGADRLPGPAAIAGWNRDAPARWAKLRNAASQATLREVGRRPNLLSWTWEYQRRGALHKHFILGAHTASELRAAHVFMLKLDELRGRHDYGFVSDTRRSGKWRRVGPEVIGRERAARYVAKYLVKRDEGGRLELTETVTSREVPPLVVYVSRRLTARTHVTMRSLRRRRLVWVLQRRLGVCEQDAHQLADQGQAGVLLRRLQRAQGP